MKRYGSDLRSIHWIRSGPSDETLALVHDQEYLDDLAALRMTNRTASQKPGGPEVLDPQRLMTGGTVKAAPAWESKGFCMNMGGGFHHAFAGMGHGFCFYNDVAVAIRKLQHDGRIAKPPSSTATCTRGMAPPASSKETTPSSPFPCIRRICFHQSRRARSTSDCRTAPTTPCHLARMRRTVPSMLSFFAPDIVFYLAGADPYEGDRLGGLALSMPACTCADKMVLEQCFSRGIPLCVVLAGGYAKDWHDTVQIHHHTCIAAQQLYGSAQRSPSASRNCS